MVGCHKNESKVGLNLLSVNKSYAWKSTASKAYNWKTDKYIPYDGSTWVTASKRQSNIIWTREISLMREGFSV